MENFYLLFVIVLFILAISDLVVGVSNDAVNFLNSAIGAKVAKFKFIMIVAALGILIGATFSSGMMEVARKGIFNPSFFYFKDIMILFLAVMITDVLLLDLFNSFGMPTSTTVSIVFELLGAAVALAIVYVINDSSAQMANYINTSKALAIISGIFLSVVVAFTIGAIVQWLARLLFSFDYENRYKFLKALFGGVAIASITYFILIKGAKGAAFMSAEDYAWIKSHSAYIILVSLTVWTIILYLLNLLFKVNIFKIIVLTGTFALAMAFAGNDLVNFIGVPLAGLASYNILMESGSTPDTLLMEKLAGKVPTETYILIIAGVIMVLTLWTSKKARKVVKTSLDLSRQQEGEERFGSSFMARVIVRISMSFSNTLSKLVPPFIRKAINKRFDSTKYDEIRQKLGDDAPTFDMIRASVNLVVASILISIATSFKLPLSTTYVTFMVAMGSSLTDGAWGRESAVYRVTGVIAVIGGWFLTAISAFTAAFIIANIIYFGGTIAVVVMILVAIAIVFRTQLFTSRNDTVARLDVSLNVKELENEKLAHELYNQCTLGVINGLEEISSLYGDGLNYFQKENRKGLKKVCKNADAINKDIRKHRRNIYQTVQELQDNEVDTSLHYVQVVDYLREATQAIRSIMMPCFSHIDNNHEVFTKNQADDIKSLINSIQKLIKKIVKAIKTNNYSKILNVLDDIEDEIDHLRILRKKQLKRIKKEKAKIQNSIIYLDVLHESQNLIMHLGSIFKAQHNFGMYDSDKQHKKVL